MSTRRDGFAGEVRMIATRSNGKAARPGRERDLGLDAQADLRAAELGRVVR